MRFFLLATALQTAISTATLTVRTLDASTQIEKFLAKHEGEPNFGIDGHNVTHPGQGDDEDLQARSLEIRAPGKAILENRCSYDIWVWSVDGKGSKGPIKVKKRSKYLENLRSPCKNCGVSLKVSKNNRLEAGKHTQFEYAIKNNIIYYDISYVDCAKGKSARNCPGHESGHRINSPEPKCGVFHCKGGSYCPRQAYYVDKPLEKLGIPEPVKGCGNAGVKNNIRFIMCADKGNLGRRGVAGRIEYGQEE